MKCIDYVSADGRINVNDKLGRSYKEAGLALRGFISFKYETNK